MQNTRLDKETPTQNYSTFLIHMLRICKVSHVSTKESPENKGDIQGGR
jgi:hypothetical protein